jgi:two-component system cell cycle sensor histidine kinase/response regulator CckA
MSDRSSQDPQDEDELVAQRRFLRQVIDLNPSFIFAKDRAGRFTLVNQAVADNYGTTVEELVGKTDADFNSDAAQVEHFRRDDLEVMDTRREKVVPEEVITDSTGQKRWLHTIKRPIVGPDGRADQVLGVSTDITALRRLEEQLAHAQKMEAVGRLAGGVAHDFNNLLTVILGSVDMLLDTLEPGHPGEAPAEEVRRAGERAAMLTRQLLAFSRRQLLQPGVLDLNRIVTDGARMLRHLIGEDVELVVLAEAPDARVRGDATQITQVILNLAINARDAMPHGGTLTIRTLLSAGEQDAAAEPDRYVTIAVSDTGHGIAPEAVPHIFEPFFTTKPVGLGTGLGLATSYGIIEQSGGHITFTTRVGEGTTFLVHLPRTEEGGGTDREQAAPARGGSETVLVVEDEGMVRAVAAASLRAKGYDVLEASNGSEALALAAGHPGPIHLLVTDVVMPQLGGVELAARLTARRPETRVLYVSGYTDEPRVLRAARGLADHFLPKPYVGEALARQVREILDAPAGQPEPPADPPPRAPGGTLPG